MNAPKLSGTVQGEAARRFTRFTYQQPIELPQDIRQYDPDRLYIMHEYPRDVPKPSQLYTPTVGLADYIIQVTESEIVGTSRVLVFMQPNKYTEAKEPQVVKELYVNDTVIDRPEFEEEILRTVF